MKFEKKSNSGPVTFGRMFLSSVSKHQDVYALLGTGDLSKMFNDLELPIYLYMADQAKKHGKIPEVQTIAQEIEEVLPDVNENPSFYRERLERRYVETVIKRSVLEAQKHFGDKTKNPEDAIPMLQNALTDIARMKFSQSIVDFREAGPLLMKHYSDTMTGEDAGLLTGWPTYDDMSGGLRDGDYMSIVGRPMQGKSWLVIWIALVCWQLGMKVLLVSMEMTALYVLQRISSIYGNVPMSHLKAGKDFGMTNKEKAKYQAALEEAKNAETGFFVVDMNLAGTVEDVWGLVQAIQPDVTAVDGGYLMKHPTVRDRYVRVAENAELLKQSIAKECPLIVSWQFGRDAVKKKGTKAKSDSTDATLEDIGYTDVIGQVSSTVLGLMQQESVETINRKRVKILKGRNGETGEFEIKWDFTNMDFSEIDDDPEQLQFI